MTTIEWEDRTFVDIARQLRVLVDAPSTLEGHWSRAAFDTIIGGCVVDPPVASLEALTHPSCAWDMDEWPPESRAGRARTLFDCHLFAIAVGRRRWLQTLRTLWDKPKGNPDWQILCQGQIDIALQGVAPEWDDETLAFMREDRHIDDACANDRAWVALSRGDVRAAAEATAAFRSKLGGERRSWPTTTGQDALRILGRPGTILCVELRALETLVAERAPAPFR